MRQGDTDTEVGQEVDLHGLARVLAGLAVREPSKLIMAAILSIICSIVAITKMISCSQENTSTES